MPVGCQPGGDCQMQIAVSNFEVLLHRTLAEGLSADQLSPVMVLDRAGGDLGGRCRVLVDQHYKRSVIGMSISGDLAHVAAPAAAYQDGAGALGDELADHVVGGVDETTRVVAQVEDDAVDLSLESVTQRLVELGGGPVAEVEDTHIENAAEDVGGDAGHDDLLADEVLGERLSPALQSEDDVGARLAPDPVDGLVRRPTGRALAVHGNDHVAYPQPGARRWRAGDH